MTKVEVGSYVLALNTWLGSVPMPMPEIDSVRSVMTEVTTRNRLSLPGAKTILCLEGPNGVGKSTVTKYASASLYRQWITSVELGPDGLPEWRPHPRMSGAGFAPVVSVNLPSKAEITKVNRQILRFLNIKTAGTADELTTRVIDAIWRHGIRLLVIDDAHFLTTHLLTGRIVLDHIKHLVTELGEYGATLMIVGANLQKGLIVSDPQIACRLRLVSMNPIGTDTTEECREWQAQLARFEDRLLAYLPKQARGDFTDLLAPAIWRRAQGHVGETAELMCEATYLAIQDGSLRITGDHLTQVPLSERAREAEAQLPVTPRKRK
ncbi:MAG: AAA family ATPase [Actinomycetes bacterium]